MLTMASPSQTALPAVTTETLHTRHHELGCLTELFACLLVPSSFVRSFAFLHLALKHDPSHSCFPSIHLSLSSFGLYFECSLASAEQRPWALETSKKGTECVCVCVCLCVCVCVSVYVSVYVYMSVSVYVSASVSVRGTSAAPMPQRLTAGDGLFAGLVSRQSAIMSKMSCGQLSG